MISVPPPAGATMAYRLDPYSLEVVASKPKNMHDVVEPTILFYHRKSGAAGAASPQTPAGRTPQSGKKARSPQQPFAGSPSFGSPSCTAVKSPAVFSSPTPTKSPSTPSTPSVRYITVSTVTQPNITLVAPFRVAVGDNVVFLASNGGEHFGTVSHVYDATYAAPGSPTAARRLVRKARSVDQEAQRRNTKETEAVRSTITAMLQNMRPGGFGPSSLAGVEWQLDRSMLHVALAYDPLMEGDLNALYLCLVKRLGCEVQIITTLSPQSSPALSDCGTSSISEPPLSLGDFC